LLLPKRVKFKRHHRSRLKPISSSPRNSKVALGDFGLQSLQPSWVTARQIEATRRVLTRYVRRTGKIWIRIFPDVPVTERAAESRMGSGKGIVSYWIASVAAGSMLFELNGLKKPLAYKVLKLASHKLPLKTRVVERDES